MRDAIESSILAFDTSAAHCAAAVFARGTLQQSITEEMAKGQAERILVLCEEILEKTGVALQGLTAIGVGIGPGNFTGIRISVSAARGLAMSLGIPAVGVSTFEMLRNADQIDSIPNELVIVAAPRGAAYAQPFEFGKPTATPIIIDPTDPPTDLCTPNLRVTGHMADQVAERLGADASSTQLADPAGRIACLTQWKLSNGHNITVPPAPLYVRAADAAPARDAPPRIIA